MPKVHKAKSTRRQKSQTIRLNEGYEVKPVAGKKTATRAWTTANKDMGSEKRARGSARNISPGKKASSPSGRVASPKVASIRGAATRKSPSRKTAPSRSRRSSR